MGNWLVLLLGLSIATTAVWSNVPEGNPSVPRGTVEETVTSDSKPIGIELYSWGYSAPFSDPSRSAIQITNQLTVHTPAFGPFDFEVTPQFVLQPFEGERFQLLDPSVGLEGTVVESGPFTYWARYEFVLPVSSQSREAGMLFAPQAMQSFEFQVPGTRLKSEFWFIPTLKILNGKDPKLALYLSPRLTYSLTDSFSVIGLAEASLESPNGRSLLHLTQTSPWTMGLGVRYASAAGEGLWIHPFWNFSPEGTIASTSHLGLFFGGPLL